MEGAIDATKTTNDTDESGQSNPIVTVIKKEVPRVTKVCELQGIDPSLTTGGASFSWQPNIDDREPSSCGVGYGAHPTFFLSKRSHNEYDLKKTLITK